MEWHPLPTLGDPRRVSLTLYKVRKEADTPDMILDELGILGALSLLANSRVMRVTVAPVSKYARPC